MSSANGCHDPRGQYLDEYEIVTSDVLDAM